MAGVRAAGRAGSAGTAGGGGSVGGKPRARLRREERRGGSEDSPKGILKDS
jgi:hypothetical protein